MDMDTATEDTAMDTTERGLLMLLLRLPLIPITMVDTAMGTVMVCLTMVATDMVCLTMEDMVTDTDTLWATPDMDTDTARGPLMLLLRLPLIPTIMVDTAMDTVMVCLTMVATDMATAMEDMDMDMATEDTAMDTT